MRVFLDTNVLVSAFATRGLCADVLRHVLAKHDLVLGETVLAELRRALRERLHMPRGAIDDIEGFLRGYEVVPKPMRPSSIPVRDPDDAWILSSAVDARANVLVSGDRGLLTLGTKSPIRIQTPREFWSAERGK
ncbi:MAG: putative toxin-antitoxin system toxin component, PIN family [Planctomycetes bacterium]|nr:putative toxin-antitoxin system toxin component, PIN family [Planctomycetota bacterium]